MAIPRPVSHHCSRAGCYLKLLLKLGPLATFGSRAMLLFSKVRALIYPLSHSLTFYQTSVKSLRVKASSVKPSKTHPYGVLRSFRRLPPLGRQIGVAHRLQNCTIHTSLRTTACSRAITKITSTFISGTTVYVIRSPDVRASTQHRCSIAHGGSVAVCSLRSRDRGHTDET